MKLKDFTINYTDFLTKVFDLNEVLTEEDIIGTFKHFDSTNFEDNSASDISNHMSRKEEDKSK